MATTMRTAVVTGFGQPLTFPEGPMPKPRSGQIPVKAGAAGACHTDLRAANVDWPRKPPLAFIPGHKGMGRTTAPGVGVTRVDEGNRLGVPWLAAARGDFDYCLHARETVCGEMPEFSVGTP